MLSDEQVQRLMLAVRKRLSAARRSARLSQKGLERSSGVDQPTISRIEAIKAKPDLVPELPTLSRLVDGVGLRLSEFFAQIEEGSQSSSLTAPARGVHSESTALPSAPHGDSVSPPIGDDLVERLAKALFDAARNTQPRDQPRDREHAAGDRPAKPRSRPSTRKVR